MVSKISMAAGAAQSAAGKKPVVPREDPVKRLERLLAEAKQTSKAKAELHIAGAREALARAEGQVTRWVRIAEEAADKVAELEEAAGLVIESSDEDEDEEDNDSYHQGN
jgi:hypothetical protein